jgi:hypothetical protein
MHRKAHAPPPALNRRGAGWTLSRLPSVPANQPPDGAGPAVRETFGRAVGALQETRAERSIAQKNYRARSLRAGGVKG